MLHATIVADLQTAISVFGRLQLELQEWESGGKG